MEAQGFLLPFDRGGEIARLGVGGGQGIEVAG
jgi:hypothetical protein